ncbi:unnamed protein product [marine sediment metagenome]|uniref:Uncharacterized protein n=1 Tax=marine sediment metagenome TaxID=412755 RepID=X1RZN2_9ZZZZ
MLNSQLRFIALTNVEICPVADKSESGVSFVAVNKGQILSLAELEQKVPVSGDTHTEGQ